MLTAINDNKSITLLIKDKDLGAVKAILKFMSEKFPTFSAMKFRTGKIGDDVLVSFKVSEDFYPKVLEKFAYNDIPIILKDKSSLKFIKSKKEEKKRKLSAQGWSEITINKRQLSLSQLKELAKCGKVKEVLREAKGGVSSNIEIVKTAKALLSETISTAIENLVKYALEKPGRRQEAIDQLILISTDKDLKLLQKYEEINNAGLTAIELSLTHKNYYDNLINISNNTKLNNLINIKAVIAFSGLLDSHSENELSKLPDAVKLLNTRWLKIALETVQFKLTSEEIQKLDSFIALIENKRQATLSPI